MAVRIRLKRLGRRNRPFYRIVAMDSRSPRDGKAIERLGHYDPFEKDHNKSIVMDEERVKYWLSVGAKPTETVASFLKARQIALPWVKHAAPTVKGAEKRAARAKVTTTAPKTTAVPTKAEAKKAAEEKAEELKGLSRAEKKQMKKA